MLIEALLYQGHLIPSSSWGPLVQSPASTLKKAARPTIKYCILYQFLVYLVYIKDKAMARNTSILLGDYFESFIHEKIKSGQYSSVSEVVRAALRLFEQEENKAKILVNELKVGEKSGMVKNMDRKKHLKNLHKVHLKK